MSDDLIENRGKYVYEPVDVIRGVVGRQADPHATGLAKPEESRCLVGVERTSGRVDVVLRKRPTDRCGVLPGDGDEQRRCPPRSARVDGHRGQPTQSGLDPLTQRVLVVLEGTRRRNQPRSATS